MYISIKTKFVLLLSLLIAILLAVQFYFNQKAQNDLLDEIELLSTSINKATDAHFRGVLKSLQEKRIPGYPNKVNWIETKVFNDEDFNDSLYVKIHDQG